ncbi:DUF6090 family protein [Maribacter sp. CXY002]|uniref:DUF6090 family protein n=1 Tax=Maribacter luteocoastalis TaxID=3407671 RepID=UPI003B681C35
MIKFFRKIRQNLLSEGRTSKYLKYAIGEIVLVVIGILIAIQIDNWNEERKNTEIKESLVENLIADLNEDIQNLEALNTINTNAENEGVYLASYLENALVEIDSLRLINSIVFSGYVPNKSLISSTYNDLINSNNLQLFHDVKLKRLLDDYYVQNSWFELLNSRILKTAWYDYRDEMSKFHSPRLYEDFYEFQKPIESNATQYLVKWNQIKNNEFIKTQVGMIGAYRILIRQDFEKYILKAKTILNYLEETK